MSAGTWPKTRDAPLLTLASPCYRCCCWAATSPACQSHSHPLAAPGRPAAAAGPPSARQAWSGEHAASANTCPSGYVGQAMSAVKRARRSHALSPRPPVTPDPALDHAPAATTRRASTGCAAHCGAAACTGSPLPPAPGTAPPAPGRPGSMRLRGKESPRVWRICGGEAAQGKGRGGRQPPAAARRRPGLRHQAPHALCSLPLEPSP
jgi:hypothetical protein